MQSDNIHSFLLPKHQVLTEIGYQSMKRVNDYSTLRLIISMKLPTVNDLHVTSVVLIGYVYQRFTEMCQLRVY